MSFAVLPVWGVIAGALALAGLLFALQRLRARQRVVFLPAMTLWQQALRTTQLRVLGGRFRYWLAYLLALAIALLLWVAAAHPVLTPGGRADPQLFYLDLSAALTAGDTAAIAKRRLLADVRATPAATRTVYLGDTPATVLLAPGESASLLARRLDGLRAVARPSTFGDWVDTQVARLPHGAVARVRYYGAWPAARPVAARRSGAVRLAYGFLAAPVAGNRGIVAFGATPAASGRWSAADVLIETAGAGITADTLRWTLDGAAFTPPHVERAGAHAFLLRDVAATGGVLRATLSSGDGFAADDVATLRLPDRRPIRVAVRPGIPPAVIAAIRADDGLAMTVPAKAQIIVRTADDRIAPALPALILTPDVSAATFRFAGPGERPDDDLSDRLDELGLAQVDAGALADTLHRPIAVEVAPAPRRSVTVWRAVFDDRSGFVKSAAMPLFVSHGLRWLAGGDHWIPYAKTGTPPIDQSRLYGLPSGGDTGLAVDTASLTDRGVTAAASDTAPRPAVTVPTGHLPPDLPFLLALLCAGMLLAVEWWLFQHGRIP